MRTALFAGFAIWLGSLAARGLYLWQYGPPASTVATATITIDADRDPCFAAIALGLVPPSEEPSKEACRRVLEGWLDLVAPELERPEATPAAAPGSAA